VVSDGFYVVADFLPAGESAPPSVGPLIDSVEACAILGVTANHLRQLVFRGQLATHGKRSRRTLLAKSDVEALREARQRE
jgi:hypothetical protein